MATNIIRVFAALLSCTAIAACVASPDEPEGADAPVVETEESMRRQCGGIAALQCPEGYACVDDPSDSCDPDNGGADCGGVCVKDKGRGPRHLTQCGGIAALPCPEGYTCVDDPSDSCDPDNGGADCGGVCVKDKDRGPHKPKKCDDPARAYVSTDREQCAVIRFLCPIGTAPFSDDCGCGCEATEPAAELEMAPSSDPDPIEPPVP